MLEKFEDTSYHKYKFGYIVIYPLGSVVVWRGNNPCIGRIKMQPNLNNLLIIANRKKPPFDESTDLFLCYGIDKNHSSLSFRNLRFANDEEVFSLGKKNKILIE